MSAKAIFILVSVLVFIVLVVVLAILAKILNKKSKEIDALEAQVLGEKKNSEVLKNHCDEVEKINEWKSETQKKNDSDIVSSVVARNNSRLPNDKASGKADTTPDTRATSDK